MLGVDGARGGWLIAEHAGESVRFEFAEALEPCVERLRHGGVDVVAVDMPIGLSARGHRPADQLARNRLGARRSTFFPTPIRSLLDFDDYAEANLHAKETTGKGVSKQAWNLIPKIREVDALWRPELAGRLVETHPETSFGELAGAPLLSKKSSLQGRQERVELLRGVFGAQLEDALEPLSKSLWVDALDAAIAAWTAMRVATGDAIVLGGELDPAGRPMQLTI